MDFVTRRLKLSDVFNPDSTKELSSKYGIKEDVQFVRKGIVPGDIKFYSDEHASVDYVTTKQKDRDSEIVLPKGIILDDYRKNPVVLFGHNYKEMPIGKCAWIKLDGDYGLVAKTIYHTAPDTMGQKVFEYRSAGFPMAKSIGFAVLETYTPQDFSKIDLKSHGLQETDLRGVKAVFSKTLLFEYSDVPVPSNPGALEVALSKGLFTQEEAEKKWFVQIDFQPEQKDGEDEREDEAVAGSTETKGTEETSSSEEEKEIKSCECVEETESGEDGKCKACGRNKPKKSFEPIPEENMIKSFTKTFSSYAQTSFEKDSESKSYWGEKTKAFDVSEVKAEPSSFELDIMAKFLECHVKDIFLNSYSIPGALTGSYLSAFDNEIKTFDVNDIRNFGSHGDEHPNIYEVIELNSKESKDFLMDGSYYCRTKNNNIPIIMRFAPSWDGLQLSICSSRNDKDLNREILQKAHDWVKENNYLKGEKFALSGGFLDVKQSEDWTDLFLAPKVKESLRMTSDLINKKGENTNNRGLLLIGPPGTGKTLSGRVLMKEANSTFIWVSSKDFSYGGVVYNLGLGFKLARDLAPSILFIEDIDTWLGDYSVDLLKTEMDGIRKTKGLVTILTSNYPERLPKALIDRPGRFHDVLEFSLPTKDVRKQMLEVWIDDEEVQKSLIDSVLEETEGFSGAHMYELIEFAKTIAEDKGINMGEAIQESLKKLAEQKELINNLQPGVYEKPSIRRSLDESDTEIETKSEVGEFLVQMEDETVTEDEVFVVFEEEKVMEVMKRAINKSFQSLPKHDLQEEAKQIIDEGIKTMKGIVVFE